MSRKKQRCHFAERKAFEESLKSAFLESQQKLASNEKEVKLFVAKLIEDESEQGIAKIEKSAAVE